MRGVPIGGLIVGGVEGDAFDVEFTAGTDVPAAGATTGAREVQDTGQILFILAGWAPDPDRHGNDGERCFGRWCSGPNQLKTIPQGLLVDAGQPANPKRYAENSAGSVLASQISCGGENAGGDGEFVHRESLAERTVAGTGGDAR